jgi:hypothetical protein
LIQRNNEAIVICIYTHIYVGDFYPDGIIKYDGFSTSQIDRTISKETIPLRKDITSLDRLADYSTAIRNSTITRLPSVTHCVMLSHCLSLPQPLLSFFLYPRVVLHLRVVNRYYHSLLSFDRITSSRESQRFLSRLFFVLDAKRTCASASLITSF